MTTTAQSNRLVWLVLIVVVLVAGSLSIPAVRNVALKSLQSLRMQKVQAVNADFSPYVDANANPTLHQMVTQMISDKVQVEVNEEDQPVTDVVGANKLAGFDVRLLGARKDTPKIVVGGSHKIAVTVDRSRLQAIATEAGHPDSGVAAVPRRRDGRSAGPAIGASAIWNLPRSDQRRPGRRGQYHRTIADDDPVQRLRPAARRASPIVNVPAGLDVGGLAEIGLETAGMTPNQATIFSTRSTGRRL